MKRLVAWILALLSVLLLLGTAAADGTVLPPCSEASDGCVLAEVSGEFSVDAPATLHQLNLYRYQACYHGEPDPRFPERKLRLADRSGGENPSDAVLNRANGDYVPAKWNADLQRIAEIRAVEASFVWGHTRPNGMQWYTVSVNGMTPSMEGIASCFDAVYSLEVYYSEHDYWVNQDTSRVTEHYTSMIDPDYRYYGVAGFMSVHHWHASALEARYDVEEEKQDPIPREGIYTQIIDFSASMLTSLEIIGDTELTAYSSTHLKVQALYYDEEMKVYEGAVFKSSDPSVVCIGENNGIAVGLKPGSANITATVGGETATCRITVGRMQGTAGGRCGATVYWTLDDAGTLNISGLGDTWPYRTGTPSFLPHSSKIKKIVFTEGVTSVGENLLNGLNKATELDLSETIANIAENSMEMASLQKITVKEANPSFTAVYSVLYSKDLSRLVKYPAGKTNKSYRFPDGLTHVDSRACVGVNALETITFPAGLKTIGREAFKDCSKLKSAWFLGERPDPGKTGDAVFGNNAGFTIRYPSWFSNSWTGAGHSITTWGDGYPIAPFSVTVNSAALEESDVQFKGTTPYVVYNGKAQCPRVIVKDNAGRTVGSNVYSVTYRNNVRPSTAYADVTLSDGKTKKSVMFKIYLPATTETSVYNSSEGITVSWNAVRGARGYVIYRRAWNLASSGWTTFERWNNTTATTWTDTKVYAGTRYQYGVKAYYADPMDNYNLGIVGPLKTEVRITTRKLQSVTAGKNQMTVKWDGSRIFTGYQVAYTYNPTNEGSEKIITIERPDQYSTVIKKLYSGVTYYVAVRSYHVFNGMTYYGEWSNTGSCTIR